eukprot:scaffold20949_cov62-Phaeocystis_antarctica.AAC.2
MLSEEQQPQAEGLTLVVADNKTGYFGVYHQPGRPKPYQAQVRRGGPTVTLGSFATAEEAALCIARSPEGQAAAAEQAAALPPLTSEEARQQAQAERLTLLVADNKTGYSGVHLVSSKIKPYKAQVWRGGTQVYLGCFATAEEAALCAARSPEGQAAAEKAAAAPPPTPSLNSEEARQQAQAEGLTLRVAENSAGYFGVNLNSGRSKPYQAKVRHGGKIVYLGSFATAEQAALCVARSPEGQAAAAAALSEEEGKGKAPAMPAGAVLKEEGAVPPMPLGAFVKDEEVAPPMPPGAFFKEEEVVPPMPPDAVVKREHEVVVEERSQDGPVKRQRNA